jgi:hypothetical protein
MPSRLSAAPRVSTVLNRLRRAAHPVAISGALAVIVFSASTHVGDVGTSLTNTQPLTFFDVAGTGPATFSAVTSSNPTVTCTASASGANFVLNDCFGNLGPGQGVTLTITASALTAGSITASGVADPALIVPEFKEDNNAVFQKLNTTIENAVKPFAIGSGGRFVYVDTYKKLRDHCMKMEVEIKTKVEHPEEMGAVHQHDSPKVNFGCSDNWFVEGSDGNAVPFYLNPASIGVLIEMSQTTSGMGVHPNEGHTCISDLIWEADTLEPGVTPLKWKLSIPEAPKTDICQ